uniref:Uncharacterized protein n=1 Tax=Mimivirus LCMiAC02 TaxID=2506609 RepID=A0A481Z1N7_9VIRU|nr:MAG: hypothetical protein LCMiAC02_02340 [Mimivirus LCMiAC02]
MSSDRYIYIICQSVPETILLKSRVVLEQVASVIHLMARMVSIAVKHVGADKHVLGDFMYHQLGSMHPVSEWDVHAHAHTMV